MSDKRKHNGFPKSTPRGKTESARKRKCGVREKINDGLGSAKEISAALSRSLEKRGLMKPLGSMFGAAKRYVE